MEILACPSLSLEPDPGCCKFRDSTPVFVDMSTLTRWKWYYGPVYSSISRFNLTNALLDAVGHDSKLFNRVCDKAGFTINELYEGGKGPTWGDIKKIDEALASTPVGINTGMPPTYH